MRRAGMVIVASMLFATSAAPVEQARFARFKFQPEKRYRMKVFHKSLIHFLPGEDTTVSEIKEKLSMENQILCNVVVETFPLTNRNTIPMKMRFENMNILVKSRGKSVSMPLSKDVVEKMEYVGELDESGTIRAVKRPALPENLRQRSFDLVQLLNLIPDLPAGSYAVGAAFHPDPSDRTLVPGEGNDPDAVRYIITAIEGDDVLMSAEQSSTTRTRKAGESEETVLGTAGKMVYSMSDSLWKSFRLDVRSSTVRKKEPGGAVLGVMVNDMRLEIELEESKP